MNTATLHYNGVRFQNPLLLYASPREDGHTRQLLNQVLPLLPLDKEPEFVSAFQMEVKPCIDCRVCYRKECPLNGDGMGALIEKIKNADLLLCASPIYFNGVPAPMKAIIDRSQQLFVKRFIRRVPELSAPKSGILLTTAGSDDENAASGVREVYRMFFACLGVRLASHVAIAGTDHQSLTQIPPSTVERLLASL